MVVVALLPTSGALDATVGERQTTATVIAHFFEFVVLAVLVASAEARRRQPGAVLVVTLTVAAAVAVLTELLQGLLPYRSLELRDLAVNLLGAGAGLVLFTLAGAVGRATRERRA